MNKRIKMMMYIGLGVFAGYVVGNKENRLKIKGQIEGLLSKIKQSSSPSQNDAISYAGIPDQSDFNDETQIENAKMVSEGSQYGVHYYNEFQATQEKEG